MRRKITQNMPKDSVIRPYAFHQIPKPLTKSIPFREKLKYNKTI